MDPYEGLTFNVGPLVPPHEQRGLQRLYAPPALALDVPTIAALGQLTSGRSVQPCLFDNGASSCITSFYHGEIPGTRRPTEVPQGFQQGTGKLRCDTTFLARRDLAGTNNGSVARTEMKWQHTDATQFEIVSEGYLRDEMGCSFVDHSLGNRAAAPSLMAQ